MIPLVLDLLDRKLVIFGGGQVALRKARYFQDEVEVTVVSLDFDPGFDDMRVMTIWGDAWEHAPDLIDASDLVIAATDDEKLNQWLCDMARSKRKLYNQANGLGNFLIPSVVDKGTYLIAVSTLGRSPALARYLRRRLEEELGEELELMALLQERLRAELRSAVPERKDRESLLRMILDDVEVWELLPVDQERAMERARELVRRSRK